MNVQNIMVCQLRYIGDVLLCVPILRALRTNHEKAHIVMVVNPGTEEILRHNPYVDEVLVVSRSWSIAQLQFLRGIRRRHFDCVLDLTDGDRSALLTAVTGAAMKVGFNRERRWRGWMYSECVHAPFGSVHMVDYHAQVLTSLGIPTQVGDPEIFVDKDEEQTADHLLKELGIRDQLWIMLHPTARYWFKAWPPERFATLSDWLQDHGFPVILVGGPEGREVGQRIQQTARHPIASLMGQTSLLELAALMKRCALFIGNDGGPMHMAAAMERPVVALFGPSDPKVWGPRGTKSTVLYKGLDCRECFYPGCARGESSCMKQITVEEVIEASKVLLPMGST